MLFVFGTPFNSKMSRPQREKKLGKSEFLMLL
jgi:hypothetical protein